MAPSTLMGGQFHKDIMGSMERGVDGFMGNEVKSVLIFGFILIK